MRLFLLERNGDDPEFELSVQLVVEENEQKAREMAACESGNEGPEAWLREAKCTDLTNLAFKKAKVLIHA